jgi:uncharacterized protein YhjY with autotransporter beta-barrel domain
MQRNMNFSVNALTVNEAAFSSTDSDMTTLSIGAGREYRLEKGAVVEVSGFAALSKTDIDPFVEAGANGLNLAVQGQSIDSLLVSAGATISKAFGKSWGVLIPQAGVRLSREMKDDGEAITAHFVSDPAAATFTFTTARRDSNFASLSAGLVAVYAGGTSAFLQYGSDVGIDDYKQSMLSLGVRTEFQ